MSKEHPVITARPLAPDLVAACSPFWFDRPDMGTGPVTVSQGRIWPGYLVLFSDSPLDLMSCGVSLAGYGTRPFTVGARTVRAAPVFRPVRGGHAPLDLPLRDAWEWYRKASVQIGFVAVGGDRRGVWVAGAALAGCVAMFDGVSLVGDWRENADGVMELVAVVCGPEEERGVCRLGP